MVPALEKHSLAGGRQTCKLKNYAVKCFYRNITKALAENRAVNLG